MGLRNLFLFLLAGCAPRVCPVPTQTTLPAMGDANGDGEVDISDGLRVQRHLLSGGKAPLCTAAADMVQDGRLDVGDGLALWAQLYTGAGTRPTLEPGACTTPAAEATPECGRATLEIQVPSKAEGSFEATVELDSTLAVEGWQLSVVAEGCRITAADLAGTVGAHQREGGRRSEGYARAEVVEGGALSVVALNYLHEDSLGSGRLLRLEVEAEASGCGPCTLRLEDGRKGRGEALKNVLSAGGHSWFPKLPQARVQLCGG